MTIGKFRDLALSFPETVENPHFDRRAFKVVNKRIFATLHEPGKTVNLKLSEEEQYAFCALGKKAIYPVPNKWGIQGWTTFELNKVTEGLMRDALEAAYKNSLIRKSKR